jgi:prepilin-type N-terminal cleavage/methylation domain-containing protein
MRKAFTLIELLAVIFIMSILIALVVGVGAKLIASSDVKQTRASMHIILSATDAYYDSYSEYPPDVDKSSIGFTWDTRPLGHEFDSASGSERWAGSQILWMYLIGLHYKDATCKTPPPLDADFSGLPYIQKSKNMLDKLHTEVYNCFKDSFGTEMKYQLLGGKPLLTSAGQDAVFGTQDDIRSDGR